MCTSLAGKTEGDPIEDLDTVRSWWTATHLKASVRRSPVTQVRSATKSSATREPENGYCDFSNNQIAVRPDVAPAQAVKTHVHELSHALLHGEELRSGREVTEVEVESVTCIVCARSGLTRAIAASSMWRAGPKAPRKL